MPSVSGNRRILTGSFPAMQAAACSRRPPAAPLQTRPASAPVRRGDFLACLLVEFIDVYHDAGRAGHLFQDLGPGPCSAVAGDRPRGVDNGGYAQPPVYLFRVSRSGSGKLCHRFLRSAGPCARPLDCATLYQLSCGNMRSRDRLELKTDAVLPGLPALKRKTTPRHQEVRS